MPRGTHRVTFSYAPPAEALSVAALLIGCIWLVIGSLPRRTDSSTDDVAQQCATKLTRSPA